MYRSVLMGVPLLVGGYWVFGEIDGYSRVVDRPPAQVAAAIDDLDIRDQPGSPGTDASRAGGIMPVFKHVRSENAVTWTVMSGNQVAVTMTAHLTPIDGGKRTKVTASVERGDAPDDVVSPAFRSSGITLGLFGMALESELNEMTAPPADPVKCAEFFRKFEAEGLVTGNVARQDGVGDAMGDVATTAMRLAALDAEARRSGCRTEKKGEAFGPVSNEMSKGRM